MYRTTKDKCIKIRKDAISSAYKKTMETSRKKINKKGKEIVENSFDKHFWLDR